MTVFFTLPKSTEINSLVGLADDLILGLMTSFLRQKLNVSSFIMGHVGQKGGFPSPGMKLFALFVILVAPPLHPRRGFLRALSKLQVCEGSANNRGVFYSISLRLLQITFQCVKPDFH